MRSIAVTVSSSNYDSATGKYTVDLIQSGYEDQKEETNQYPWIVPVKYSLIKNGVALKNDVVILNDTKVTLELAASQMVRFRQVRLRSRKNQKNHCRNRHQNWLIRFFVFPFYVFILLF